MKGNDLEQIDKKLALLYGNSLEIDGIKLNPVKLKSIVDIGYGVYIQYLTVITLSVEKLYDLGYINSTHIGNFKLTPLEFFTSVDSEELRQLFLNTLNFFLLSDDILIDGRKIIIDKNCQDKEEKIVDRNNYNKLQELIKIQNYVKESSQEDDYKPAGKEAEELLNKLNSMKQKVREKRSKDVLDISDIISIVSVHSTDINIFNVWDLTIYQLYNYYIREMKRDNYNIGMQAKLNAAEPEKVNVDHWASKINN